MQSITLSDHSILRSLTRFIVTALVLIGFSISSVNAVVLTFDDVPGGSIQTALAASANQGLLPGAKILIAIAGSDSNSNNDGNWSEIDYGIRFIVIW